MKALYDRRDFHLYLSESGRRREGSILPTTQLTTCLEDLSGVDLGKSRFIFWISKESRWHRSFFRWWRGNEWY